MPADLEAQRNLVYFVFAHQFGFTPKEVDEMTREQITDFLLFLKKVGLKIKELDSFIKGKL